MPESHLHRTIRPDRTCSECGARLLGRSDKRFCSDHCRNAFHNRENREVNVLLRRVNQKLRRNYRILQWALLQGRSFQLRQEELQALGFDFYWYTRMHRSGPEGQAYQVYDLACCVHEDGTCRVYPVAISSY